jgi:polysaccharide biosynthesis protein PslH
VDSCRVDPKVKKSTDTKGNFNVALNGYRGFCALLVFVYHIGNAGVLPWPSGTVLAGSAAFLWSSARYGVEMFFMISGFVIVGSLLRHVTLSGFLQDRFVRIYSAWVPALVAVTAVCIGLKMKMFTDVSFLQGLGIFVSNVFLLPPLLPLPLVHQASWSLTYEWVFYISAAMGALLLRRKTPQTWAVVAWAILSGLFVCLYPRSLFFLTGVIVFGCQPWFKRRERWLKLPLVSLLVFLVAWRLTGADKADLRDTVFDWLRDGRWVAALAAFGASLHMFASVTLNASRQFAFLRSRAFQFVGTISYSFYLWATLVVSATKRLAIAYFVPHYGVAIGFLFFFISSIAIGLLVSWASWALFEVKIAKLYRKVFIPNQHFRRPSVPREPASAFISIDDQIRCLWISRYIPFPSDDGAKVYSANLAQSLADSGVFVRFMGFGDAGAVQNAPVNVDWLPVPGNKRNKVFAALSKWPIAAAIDATQAYILLLETQLKERWDAVVLDGYGTGWALDRCLAYRYESHAHRPVLVHVSHNHEELLWGAMAREARGSPLKRLALRRNASRVSTLERRIVRNVDLLTTITDEDRRSLGADSGLAQSRSLTLSPGHSGWVASERNITAATPRRVIIMGSFQWVVKQENLSRFLEIADPVFKENGIELEVVGDIPRALLATLQRRCRATRFHGFVTDVAPFLSSARIAVVPESIGGGFKLKLLDYIFGRVPVATFSQAAAGLSADLQRAMLSSDSLSGLIREIVSHMDAIDELNRIQERAFALGKAQFKWSDRGARFHRAIANVRQEWAQVPRSAEPCAKVQNIDLAVN